MHYRYIFTLANTIIIDCNFESKLRLTTFIKRGNAALHIHHESADRSRLRTLQSIPPKINTFNSKLHS